MLRPPTARRLATVSLGPLLAWIVAAGCSTFSGSDGTDAPDSSEATTADAQAVDGAPPDAPSDSAPLDVVQPFNGGLLSNGSFEETNGVGCGTGWVSYNGTGVLDKANAHHGAQSCRVCYGSLGGQSFFVTANLLSPQAGMYAAEAYVRPAPGQPAPPKVYFSISSTNADGGVDYSATPSPVTPTDWGPVQTTIAVGADAGNVAVNVGGSYEGLDAGQCILVDAVKLIRQ
jgi:hypothetical protein